MQLYKDENEKQMNSTLFKSMVGGLRYLVHTRTNTNYSVGVVSRFMEKPTVLHLSVVKRILRYVKGTLNYRLVYTKRRGDYFLLVFRIVTLLEMLMIGKELGDGFLYE